MSNRFVSIKEADLIWREDLPFSIQYNDIYYSKEGGLEQSRYVFVDGNNLTERWKNLPNTTPSYFNIAETGFGTGLNFLLVWSLWEQYAPLNANLHFISCEKHPLNKSDLIKCLNHWPEFSENALKLIEQYPVLTPGYHRLGFCNGRITLTLMIGEALECFEQLLHCGEPKLENELRTTFIDAWFLDGFAPKFNPEIWSQSLFNCIALLSKEGTTLSTYTAAQPVKSALCASGFVVKKLKGFGPKRHMITAYYSTQLSKKNKCHTPWHVGIPQLFTEKKAVIIGAGLAGCFVAYFLAIRGWTVTLIDENNAISKGASGNQQAVLFPKLSAYRSPLTQFMLSSFLYAHQFYKTLLKKNDIGELKGSLLLAYNDKERKAQESLEDWLQHYPELGLLVNTELATELSGIALDKAGLFIPLSGWINSPKLCHLLIDNPNITLIKNKRIEQLVFQNGKWLIDDIESEVVILANGNKANCFEQTSHLPIKYIRGQMTTIAATNESTLLKIPLCGEGHVLPVHGGLHHLGATYDLGVNETYINAHDDELNIGKLLQTAPRINWSTASLDHWAGVRASTPDYIPLVGQVAQADNFLKTYLTLETNSNRWIPKPGSYYPGLYICAAFGSRGLTTIPLCADWLVSSINNELGSLPRHMIQAISPARFLRRDIIRGKSS